MRTDQISSKVQRETQKFSAWFAQKTAAEETSTRQAVCWPHLLLAFPVFMQNLAHCSQIRCPTTQTWLLLLQKKISQTEHWLFAEITIKIAIMRFIPSCCNVIDLSTLVFLTSVYLQVQLRYCYTIQNTIWFYSGATLVFCSSGTTAIVNAVQNAYHTHVGGYCW